MLNLYFAEKMHELQEQRLERRAREFWKFKTTTRESKATSPNITSQIAPVCCTV